MKCLNALATQIILHNDYIFSEACLTFMKHTNNGNVRFNFCKKFGQRLESPSDRDLVRSKLCKYISNSNKIMKKSPVKAKNTGLLKLQLTFHRYNTNQPKSKDFNLQQITNPKQLLPLQLTYKKPLSNQKKIVCDDIVHNVCIFNNE